MTKGMVAQVVNYILKPYAETIEDLTLKVERLEEQVKDLERQTYND